MEKNVFTLLHDKHPVGEAVVRAYGMDLVPASRRLEKADSIFKEFAKRENLISRALKPVRDQYDYILFDCQPHLGILTINALVASSTPWWHRITTSYPCRPNTLPSRGFRR